MSYRTLDDVDPRGLRVLLRADLNVPVRDGKISDHARIERVAPTVRELCDRGARVIVLSHFDRPKGRVVPHMSLQPLAAPLAQAVGHAVRFCATSIGDEAEAAVEALADGEVLLLENTRFHPGEEDNDEVLAQALAAHGDLYVNDAFSAAHRAHASTHGIAHHLPSVAGRLMQAELAALTAALETPDRPVGAVIGGAKVSTKLELIGNVIAKVDVLFIGGAMANTFLAAEGIAVGKSLQEPDMHETARRIVAQARETGCEIVLPVDAVVAHEFRAGAPSRTVLIGEVPADTMILDAGPRTIDLIEARLRTLKTLVWNGPLGAFEIAPFDAGTNAAARAVAKLTQDGHLKSIAGGGDTVSALRHAGVEGQMSYVSTAGGAFLEWLEGKTLPGIAVLQDVIQSTMPL